MMSRCNAPIEYFGPDRDVVRSCTEAVGKSTSQKWAGCQPSLLDRHRRPRGYPALPLFPTTRDQATCPNGSTCQRDNYTMYRLQTRFFKNALYGDDQLRQRVAFALHQIIVVSGADVTQPSWMTPYLQTLRITRSGRRKEETAPSQRRPGPHRR